MKPDNAFPVHGGNGDDTRNHTLGGGLTKRELFAAMAMQGMSNSMFGAPTGFESEIAKRSVRMADELLKQLEL